MCFVLQGRRGRTFSDAGFPILRHTIRRPPEIDVATTEFSGTSRSSVCLVCLRGFGWSQTLGVIPQRRGDAEGGRQKITKMAARNLAPGRLCRIRDHYISQVACALAGSLQRQIAFHPRGLEATTRLPLFRHRSGGHGARNPVVWASMCSNIALFAGLLGRGVL